MLRYSGLPWRGELCLTDSLRLGSPSEHDGTALLGPRYIIVDAQVEAIDWPDAAGHFDVPARGVGFADRRATDDRDDPRQWTRLDVDDADGRQCQVRGPADRLRRIEQSGGHAASWSKLDALALCATSRLVDRRHYGRGPEQVVPEDIISLWHGFAALSAERRQQFQQAASLYQLALMLFGKFRTASFAFMVAACEALKPGDDEFREHNASHVIEALLGKSAADQLRSHPVRPQDVRSVHFHRGEFRGDEFLPRYFLASFDDPTFDESLRHLARLSHNAIIEWLKNGGAVVLPPVRRRATWRRRVRDHALGPSILALVLGWLLGTLTSR